MGNTCNLLGSRFTEVAQTPECAVALGIRANPGRGPACLSQSVLAIRQTHGASCDLSYVALGLARNEVSDIVRGLGLEALRDYRVVLRIWFVNGTAYLLSWIAFSLSFAQCVQPCGKPSRGLERQFQIP